jgi:SAM-dependent methyltransferase
VPALNPAEYDRMYALEDGYWWFVGRRQLALGLLGRFAAPQTELLDLGCGTGVVMQHAASNFRVSGLDMSEQALRYSASRGIQNLVQADGTKLPFGAGQFGAVIALDIFEHIDQDEVAFSETFRCLKPGGVLVMSVPAYPMLWGPHDVALHHFRRYRRAELAGKLRAAGFEVPVLSFAVFWLFPLVLLSRLLDKLRSGKAEARLPSVPGWLNAALSRLQGFEGRLIFGAGVRYPWGSSLVAVARKPR